MSRPRRRWTHRLWMKGLGGGPHIELFTDGPAGMGMALQGRTVPRPPNVDDRTWVYFCRCVFEGLTGLRPEDLERWAEAAELDPNIAAARREAGWDPNP